MKIAHALIALCVCSMLVAASEPGDRIVWWEAEQFTDSDWPGGRSCQGPFNPADPEIMLSGGKWLSAAASNFSKHESNPYLQYNLEIPAAGEYVLWVRCFGMSSNGIRNPMRVRFDDQAWQDYPRGTGTTLHKVKPTSHSTLAWIRLGAFQLAASQLTMRLEVLDRKDAAGFDCFVLANKGAFHPNGPLKPGTRLGLADPGNWAFEPDADTFSAKAAFDLSSLNHTPAGSRGWISRSADGNDLSLEGKPIRLWSVELGADGLEIEDLDQQARFLAKRGVNAVRYFEGIEPKGDGSAVGDIDVHVREKAWRVVAAMRKHGIYVLLTPFWTYNAVVQRSWELMHHPAPPGAGRRKPDGAFIVEPELRQAYRKWIKAYLGEPNPYTGVPLSQDPAVWCVQIHNEQSPLFYTYLYGCQPGALRDFGRQFGDWLTRRYGSLDATWKAWGVAPGTIVEPGNDFFPGDDLANGIVGIPPHLHGLSAAYLRSKKTPEPTTYDLRNRDYLRFLAGHMHSVYAELADFLRKDLGYRGIISPCNWKSRDQVTLDDVERWTYTAGDIMDRHHYVGGPHLNPKEGAKAGWQINIGDLYQPRSTLTAPMPSLPTNFKAVEGYPTMITESSWTPPERYQSEGPLLVACYGALTGLDMFNWFRMGGVGWDQPMGKWDCGTPALLGQFPATALVYRLGYVREAAPVIMERRSLEEMWTGRFPLIAEDVTYDPNVNAKFVAGLSDAGGSVPSQAFLAGPVRASYAEPQKQASSVDSTTLTACIDAKAGTIRSATGELLMDTAKGLFTVNAPRAQGATGALGKAGRIQLTDIAIDSAADYAAIVVVPLDGQPIADSRRLLVQMGTVVRPYGWKEEEATIDLNLHDKKAKQPNPIPGLRITSIGKPLWNVRRLEAALTVRNPRISTASALDANGLRTGDAMPLRRDGALVTLTLPTDALYLVLE